MSLEEKNELGKTLESYHNISIVLNSFPEKEQISVKDLADRAGVHWNTAKKALVFFNLIRPVIPKITMESDSKFEITEKPTAMNAIEGIFESLEMRIVVKLMLRRAITSESAILSEDLIVKEEKKVVETLISRGFVNSIEGKFFLSKKGQSLAGIGMRKLVELRIDLPWEKPTAVPSPLSTEDEPRTNVFFANSWDVGVDKTSSINVPTLLYATPASGEVSLWDFKKRIC